MKIAHVVSTFSPYKGGIGNVCRSQALELARLGHEVTVFTPRYGRKKPSRPPLDRGGVNPPPDKGEPEGACSPQPRREKSYLVKRLKSIFKYGNAAFVPQIFFQLGKFDAIHLHYPFFGGAEAVWLARRLGIIKVPLVWQYHMDTAGKGWLKYFFSAYRRLLLPQMIKAADKVIVATSDYAENSDIKLFLQKEPQKFVEIPFGVDGELFRPAAKDAELAAKYGFKPEDKIILFVGGLDKAHYFKGLEILIKAFSSINKLQITNSKLQTNSKFKIENSKLLIAGEGDLRLSYEALAKEAGLADCVIFAGSVSSEDLPRHYNLADIFVLPSVDKSEAFGLVLLEAMACAKPVIASDLPGVRQVAKEGGLTFKVGDAAALAEKMKYLLENDGVRQELGERGRRAAEEKYDWGKTARELEKIYGKLSS